MQLIFMTNQVCFFQIYSFKTRGRENLPDVEAIIFDEAHLLPDIDRRFLGQSISTHQLQTLAQDSLVEERQAGSAVFDLTATAYDLEMACDKFRLQLPTGSGRMAEQEVFASTGAAAAARDLLERLEQLVKCLEEAADVSSGL